MSERRDSKNRVLRKGESQRADGRYMYRYIDHNGETQTEYSWRLVERDPTPKNKKKDLSLREKEEIIKKNLEDFISCSAGKMTLNELFEFYIQLRIKTKKLKVRSANNYKSVWNKNIRNRSLGNMKISDIRKSHIICTYQDMLDEDVGSGSITLIHKNISSILNYAVSEDYIRKNYAVGCNKEVEIYTNEREALTEQEQDIFLKHIAKTKRYSKFYWMFLFMLETGCRGSEVAGVTWKDIDFKQKFLNNEHQLLYKACPETGKWKYMIEPPKTRKGNRKIPLTEDALRALKRQREIMFREGYIHNYTVDDCSGFVFLTQQHKLWNVTSIDNYLHNIVADYNKEETENAEKENREAVLLPHISAHILRHTACTRMAESGMDLRTLQEIMGHENPIITQKVYNHVDEKRLRDEVEKIDAKRKVVAI